MSEPNHDSLEWIERRAFADLVEAQTPSRRAALGLRAELEGDALALRCDALDTLLFNRVIGLGVGEPATAAQVRSVLAGYRSRYFVHVAPQAGPAALRDWLREAGLEPYRRAWNKLARGPDGPLPHPRTELEIRPAHASEAGELGAVLAEAFDLPSAQGGLFGAVVARPRWHVYVAVEQDVIAAAGLLYVERGIGYLAGGATRPSQRRRGAQLALMVARIRRALSLGCTLVCSETGEPIQGDPQHSHRNMERCGLTVVGRRENWTRAGTLWEHGSSA